MSTGSAGPRPDGLPTDASIVFDAAMIERIIARMAAEIAAELAGRDPIVMPILLGGAFTAVRLTAHFDFPYEMDSVRLARFGDRRLGGKLHWYAKPCLELDGRHILLVDDVLDRGITLGAVEHELRRMNAASVSAAVLVRKRLRARADRTAVDFVGADAPDRFLFGCGMDLEGRWRGLPDLWSLGGEGAGERPATL